MAIVNPYLSVMTFCVNVLNSSIKIYQMAGNKKDPTICCPQEIHLNAEDI
jgi:hypothetical protein